MSPHIIKINNLPLYAIYNIETIDSDYIIQVKYQVSSNWKSSLDDILFIVVLNSPDPVLVEANSRGELIGNVLQWKSAKLSPAQKGILEARLKSSECKVDHAKLQFKSFNANLSLIAASFSLNEHNSNAVCRFMAEIVISSN